MNSIADCKLSHGNPTVECIFTLDYEIYGNGVGSVRDLVLNPTQRLAEVFREFGAPFVVFVEALEFAKIEEAQSDSDIAGVGAQLRELRAAGHEIGLHLHPWWARARYESGRWHMDWSERNICMLETHRVHAIVSDAINCIRESLGDPYFTPTSFRAGEWAIQPTSVMASVLAQHGVQVDSSVFKGGRVQSLAIDYRPAIKNVGCWRFSQDVNIPDSDGPLWEMPIYTELVPFWRMLGRKRLKLENRVRNASEGSPLRRHWRDFLRFRYPRKLDFCRMTFDEMRQAIERVSQGRQAGDCTPFVAIGHSKDFVDADAVWRFLSFLEEQAVTITTFSRLLCPEPQLSY